MQFIQQLFFLFINPLKKIIEIRFNLCRDYLQMFLKFNCKSFLITLNPFKIQGQDFLGVKEEESADLTSNFDYLNKI